MPVAANCVWALRMYTATFCIVVGTSSSKNPIVILLKSWIGSTMHDGVQRKSRHKKRKIGLAKQDVKTKLNRNSKAELRVCNVSTIWDLCRGQLFPVVGCLQTYCILQVQAFRMSYE